MAIKKIIAAVCAAAAVLSLAGCGGASPGNGLNDFLSSPAKTENVGSTSQTESSKLSGSDSHSSPESIPVIEPTEFRKTAEISETILYDQNDIKITATGLTYNNYAAELALVLENNSDKDLRFSSGTTIYSNNSVNGYMIDLGGGFHDAVAAGKKANSKITLPYSELLMLGINEIYELELKFDIKADNIFDRDFEDIYTDSCVLKTSASKGFDWFKHTFINAISAPAVQRETGYAPEYISDEILFDSKGIKVISEVVATNSYGSRSLLLELENSTAEELYITTSEITLNGLRLCGSYSDDIINPGKRRVLEILFDDILYAQCADDCGLTEINSLGLNMTVMNTDEVELCSENLKVLGNPSKITFSADGEEIYNKNGVKIVSKGLFMGKFPYRDYYHLLLFVENSTGSTLDFDVEYNSLSVNGFMNDCSIVFEEVAPNGIQAVEIRLSEDSMKSSGVEDISDIKNIEFTVSLYDDYFNELDSRTVKATF